MIYQYKKYKDIDSFVNNKPKTKKDEEYTILNKCNGFDYTKKEFTSKCFGCLFCIFESKEMNDKFSEFWGTDFISKYSNDAFKGGLIYLPSARQSMKNPIKNLEQFTGVNETTNLQPWASGIVNHMCTKSNRIGMEIPVFNLDYDRNGRLDICSITDAKLLTMESKISLDDALKDERFIEQRYKYTSEIEKFSNDYTYLTLFGGKETDLFPVNSQFCTGKIGNKTERFYSMIIENRIPFISANALWCLCCKFLLEGSKYGWDNFLNGIFTDNRCIGLLSAGKVINNNGVIFIEEF